MIQLTKTVQKGGCAAKVAAAELRSILKQVRFPPTSPQVLVDGGLFDDAAIFKINDEVALVQTLDFFTPIVDTPRLFGKIAAANALSDVYAMGGLPQTALAILAFPLGTLSSEVIAEVLQGACDVLTEASTSLVGGHSIDDETLKFGLSVTGVVHPAQVWANSGARVGDRLILTKKLGTGAASAALKKSEVSEAEIEDVLMSMCQINQVPKILSPALLTGIHAATDITGFGLVGHSYQMADASRVTIAFNAEKIPFFSLTPHLLEKGFLTKAHRSNQAYVEGRVNWGSVTPTQKLLFADPQTSGGLLLSVRADQAALIQKELQKTFQFAEIVGEVGPRSEVSLQFI